LHDVALELNQKIPASLEAAKQAFRAAWDRGPTHKNGTAEHWRLTVSLF
jgi:hypothetical protein